MCHKSYTRCLEIYGPYITVYLAHTPTLSFSTNPSPPSPAPFKKNLLHLDFFPLSNSETHSITPPPPFRTFKRLTIFFRRQFYCFPFPWNSIVFSCRLFPFFFLPQRSVYQRKSSSDNFLHIPYLSTVSSLIVCLNVLIQFLRKIHIVLSYCHVTEK